MENQRTFLIIALMAISAMLFMKWNEFTYEKSQAENVVADVSNGIPSVPSNINEKSTQNLDTDDVPSIPTNNLTVDAINNDAVVDRVNSNDQIITITTDIVIAKINVLGAVIESIELLQEPVSIDKPDQGFALLKNTPSEMFVAQDGLIVSGQTAPNHKSTYKAQQYEYDLGNADSVTVPLVWQSENGVKYTKTYTFNRDTYVIDIDYKVENNSSNTWQGYLYAQFSRTEPQQTGSSFGRLPSYTGAAIYTEEDKYDKIDFKEMTKENLALNTNNGWVSMLQHYFVGAWIPSNGGNKQFYSSVNKNQLSPSYKIGYKTLEPKQISVGQTDTIGTHIYLGSKEQKRLKKVQKEKNVKGLALTVDYGVLTFIADPLFVLLTWIHAVVGNWGWSIILLTVLIKAIFYPLSAASYKSMAGMKKLQPRIKTLKERYKDDKPKFQMEMMALYKKEKINPAGGCLPVLVQIPVFLSLYWVLLESVEIRQAPFALWLQDLSAPDPYYVLPVLMGLSMWAMQKLNPAPMEDIQKKVMMVMPIALTFLFLTFPQGLVLYWVVNNVLSMAQQWYINKQHSV